MVEQEPANIAETPQQLAIFRRRVIGIVDQTRLSRHMGMRREQLSMVENGNVSPSVEPAEFRARYLEELEASIDEIRAKFNKTREEILSRQKTR